MTVRIEFDCQRPVKDPIFTVSLFNPENIQVISNYTSFDGHHWDHIEGRGCIDFRIEALSLRPSVYTCMITFAEKGDVNNVLEWHDKTYSFQVMSGGRTSYGIFDPLPRWQLVR